MEWTPDLTVGVDLIDEQHKELIRRMNAFFDAMKNGDKQQKVLEILDFLEEYVESHFRDEERLQLSSGYPLYKEHKKLHTDFIADVKQIRSDIAKAGFTVATASLVGSTLVSWLTLHIKKTDKGLGAHILSKK
jgi:hemerythrin